MARIFGRSAGLAILALWFTAAAAMAYCGQREDIIAVLKQNHTEAQIGAGVSGGYLIELWVAEDGATFSILRTDANGLSCMTAAGQGWQQFAREPPGTDG